MTDPATLRPTDPKKRKMKTPKRQNLMLAAVGAQYRPSEKWTLSSGATFDSSAVKSEPRTVTPPMGQTWRFGLGGQYQLSETANIGAAGTFMWAGDKSVNQTSTVPVTVGGRGDVAGAFDGTWFTVASFLLTCES